VENNNKGSESVHGGASRSPAAVSVGKRLKEAREKKSLTIEQVQKQTKIHSTVLVELEDGRPSDTLTDTYIRSFLKKYAQFLGLNSAELLKEYFPASAESPAVSVPIRDVVLPKDAGTPPKLFYITGLAVAAIVSLMLFVFIVGKVANVINKARSSGQRKPVSSAAKSKAAKKAAPIQKKKAAVNTRTEAKDLVPKTTPLALEIRVKEGVLVTLKRDGIVQFSRVLPAGTVEKATANNSIELDIAKAGSVDLLLNDRSIDLRGKNVIKGLEITRKGVRIKK